MHFSVVTASFRQLDFLKLCARSVADQDGDFTVEHLIQDGGSGEDFDCWASEQAFADIVSEPDNGMYDAINRGFSRATGDVVSWLNCDEQYLPGALAKVAKWFDQHPDCDILFGDVILIDSQANPISYRLAVNPMRGHIRNCFLPTFSAATFVRRRVIDEGYSLETRYKAISDMVWIEKLLKSGFEAAVLNEPLATFAQTGSNLGQSSTSHTESLEWKSETGAGRWDQALFWSILHRCRKLLAGAYRSRDVDIALHCPGTHTRVQRRSKVGGRWITG